MRLGTRFAPNMARTLRTVKSHAKGEQMAAKQQMNVQDWLDNWSAGMAAPQAKAKYNKKIQALTVNPMQAAATPQALQAYADACALSVSSGRRAQSLANADFSIYKQNAVASSFTAGINKAKPKLQKVMPNWMPVYAQASAEAANAVGTSAKVMAAINTMRRAAGKPELS